MKKYLFFVLFLFITGSIFATDIFNFSTDLIPDSLKKNAYGVVRYSKVEFEYKSEKHGIEKHSIAITVLDKNGKGLADFFYSGDKFRELKKFSAKIYDAKGNQLRKFKLSDVGYTEYSNSLATDGKHYFFEPKFPTYPFTIYYEYEINWKRGLFTFPPFVPQNDFNLSIQSANYTLIIPENVDFRTKALNIVKAPIINQFKGLKKYEWDVENIKAIEYESFNPHLKSYIPLLYLSPINFIYDGMPGYIDDWDSYARWIYRLQEERNQLPEECRNKVILLTKNTNDNREKVRILYEYLGESTRYVSIQLGIGGYQPMLASDVYETGFGDCKALSFYLKSLLEVVGISSNYIAIRMDTYNKNLFEDYPSFNEINHAILQIPLEKDTLWLECTNPQIPFGFIHRSISGHDALEVSNGGGRLCRLPDYADSLNIKKNIAKVNLNNDGSAKIQSQKEFHLKIYDRYFGFNQKQMSDQIDILRNQIVLPNTVIKSVQVVESKTPFPNYVINYDWETVSYGSKTGNRLFIPINPFYSKYDWFKKKERNHDIFIPDGFNDIDSIFIYFPEGYEIESLPMPVVLDTSFGKFQSIILPQENGLLIMQSFYFPSGNHLVSEYDKIRDFFDNINSAYSSIIILKKI